VQYQGKRRRGDGTRDDWGPFRITGLVAREHHLTVTIRCSRAIPVINRLELEKATATAEALDLTTLPVEIRVLEDIEGAFSAMKSQRADAGLVLSSPLTFPNHPRIVQSALGARMPTLGALREYAEAGVLMSYGPATPTIVGVLRRTWIKF
jgi:hypothetical protein